MDRNDFTQAVVIIHGIGEQRPMETLRHFADAVLPDPKQGGEKYFSIPDQLSESFELRTLQNRERPKTHFFEYYWAYKVEGSTFRHVFTWLWPLLFRKPSNVPKHLWALFALSWAFIISLVVLFIIGVCGGFTQSTIYSSSFLISLLISLILGGLQALVLSYIGDAARYLSPTPQNIRLRHEIRADGIQLLRKLHESGEYDRIILVGHSLGSIIAYDMLKHLWQECNRVYKTPFKSDQNALSVAEQAGLSLTDKQNPKADVEKLDEYFVSQQGLWHELRNLGNPWLVTDLITLGSPLAHAAILLASDSVDLHKRQQQRELPTNPPVYEKQGTVENPQMRFSYREWEKFEGQVKLRPVHHAGLFGITRWTNLYFPCHLNLFGDLVGGPLREWFGYGVRDVAVTSTSWLRNHTLWAHTSYWHKEEASSQALAGKLPLALDALIEALDLSAETIVELEKLPDVNR